jgi:hypothetical protein
MTVQFVSTKCNQLEWKAICQSVCVEWFRDKSIICQTQGEVGMDTMTHDTYQYWLRKDDARGSLDGFFPLWISMIICKANHEIHENVAPVLWQLWYCFSLQPFGTEIQWGHGFASKENIPCTLLTWWRTSQQHHPLERWPLTNTKTSHVEFPLSAVK